MPVPGGVGRYLITATATSGTGETSEFSLNETVLATGQITGVVFEDVAGNGLDGGETIGDLVDNPTVNGVNIRLYNDDGGTANQPDATDTLRAGPIATAGAGAYSFAGVPDGTYWVVVDSRSVSPAAGINASYLATTPWAEQTYGPDNGWCADGAGGTAARTGPGPCYGGADGATDDDISALTSSEHIARVVVAASTVADIDFGFSYNVVTNVQATGSASLTASTYQGSLDQFVRNANAINGDNAMRFVPAVPTNGAGGGGAWWRVDYTGSIASETLTYVHDAGTSINGTAYDLADGVTVRNTNSDNLGANAAGGLTVGVALVPLPQVAKPELELMRSDSGIGDGVHFESNLATGQTPSQFAVRDMSIRGFGTAIAMTGVPAAPVTNITVERNVIGSAPGAFADPGVLNALRGVFVASATNTSVINNLIGFLDNDAVTGSAMTTTAVTGNEIREAGQVNNVADAINYGGGSATGTLTGNLIVDSGGMGVDGTSTGNLVADNTITGSGQQGVQTAGIRQNGSNNLVRGNIISGSAGPGVVVPDIVNANRVTQNHFSGNGSIAIDLVEAGGDSAIGDGITVNDGATDVSEGNDGLDYPVIDSAYINGGNLTVTGFARANVEIEFYEAVGAVNDDNTAGNPHGEGVTYLFTRTEGVADADATTNDSYTDPGYGTDPDVSRFSFTIATPAGLSTGDEISAIAYLAANGTSEFGPNFAVGVPTADLTLNVTDNPDPAPLDGPLLYVLSISNGGPEAATGVTVTDTLPASVTLVSATSSQGSCTGTAVVTCNLDTILNGGTASVEILVTANATGLITNNASVTSNEVDPVPADNSASTDTDVVVASSVDVPLSQYSRLAGFLDYVVTGGSLRTGDTNATSCDIALISSENLAGIPATATVRAAYLYWAASGSTVDDVVAFDGELFTADRTFQANLLVGSNNFEFFGGFKDVTAHMELKSNPNGSYLFSGLTVDDGDPWCSSKGVLGGWTMYVIYEDDSVSGKTLIFYDGFDLARNGTTNYLLNGIYATDPPEAKTTIQAWEGDVGLGTGAEELRFNGTQLSDALNPVDNVYNSTINSISVSNSWGVDMDTFDVSLLVADKDTSATTLVGVGPDLVILNSVLSAGQVQCHRRRCVRGCELRWRSGAKSGHGRCRCAIVHGATSGGGRRALRRQRQLFARNRNGCQWALRIRRVARRDLYGKGGQRDSHVFATRRTNG